MTAPPVLFQMRFSHFNEKARWGLDYKRIPHRRRSYPPGEHVFRSRSLGGSGTLPILEIEGERWTDSNAILAELERRVPEPALYPAGEDERRRALELERHFGEGLGPGVRAAAFHELLPDGALTRSLTLEGCGPVTRAFNTAGYPLGRVAVRRALGADADGAARGRAATVAAMDRIETELDGGDHLVGDRFSVADLTAAALLSPLIGPAQWQYAIPDRWPPHWESFRDELRGRRAWHWAEETYARYRGKSAALP